MTETTKEHRFRYEGPIKDQRLLKKRMKEFNLELLEHFDVEYIEVSFDQQRKGVLTGLGVKK